MLNIPLSDVILCFSSSIDLISLQMSDHNKRVAYIAYSISTEMGFSEKDKSQILIAGLLHDCGAIREDEKMKAFQYDFGETVSERHDHGFKGWNLLRDIEELRSAAELIKFHHIHWNEPDSPYTKGSTIPMGSYIIHLADRIDVLIDRNEEILGQRAFINSKIIDGSGSMFMPDAVDAFIRLSSREYFWFDFTTSFSDEILGRLLKNMKIAVDMDRLLSLAGVLNKIIDCRSRFTATHSVGVAECASSLALKMNFSKGESKMMRIAGLMHDLGKLAVPVGVLEKNGPLSADEFNVMKKHTYNSYRVLDRIPQLRTINQWASFHHEKINGSGYPFGLKGKELNVGARIMAVSDVFTALTEQRPYRNAMSAGNAVAIIEDMVKRSHLDGDVLTVLKRHLDEINQLKLKAQNSVSPAFNGLLPKVSYL